MTLLFRFYVVLAIMKLAMLLINLAGYMLPDARPRHAGFRPAELMLLGSLAGLSICLMWIWISVRAGQ